MKFFPLFLIIPALCTAKISNYPFFNEIHDCFLFFNEFDTLDIRLAELYDYVDHFVLVEADKTFRGNSKPYYFEENKERYAQYADKIIHVKIQLDGSSDAWAREYFSRNQIMQGLTQCKDDDVIFISDCDELIRQEMLEPILTRLIRGPSPFYALDQAHYRFYYNLHDDCVWTGTVMTTYKHLKTDTPQGLRDKKQNPDITLENGGWHFSYMGGEAAVLQKLAAYSHAENDIYKPNDFNKIMQSFNTSRQKVVIDHTFPKYLRENAQQFFEKGLLLQ